MKLTLGFSPCPNDTFIFDALVNQKIHTEGLEFDPILEDVETLNRWALDGKLDITKLSFAAFFKTLHHYVLLNSGSALGKGVGPLLVSKEALKEDSWEGINKVLTESSIAIPGINTTANLLMSFAFPEAKQKIPMIFSAIEEAVQNGEVPFGLIIHENRFTYEKKGLKKVIDLGEFWEEKTSTPIPLGGIAFNRRFDKAVYEQVDRLIRRSVEFGFSNYPVITDYVKLHSQTMSEGVMRQHIDLYVTNFSIDLGGEGKHAIATLQECFNRINSATNQVRPSSLFF